MNEKFPDEKRQYLRVKKNFILSYYDVQDPSHKHNASQLKNISLGGLCFVTSQGYPPKTRIAIDLKTPYLSGTTYLEGYVLQSHEKVPGILYETRLQFDPLPAQAEFVLKKVVEYYKLEEAKLL